MKKETILKLLVTAKLLLVLLYTIGLLFVLAMLSNFKIDGWYWIAVILVYLVTCPIFISLFSVIQLFATKIRYEIAPSDKITRARSFAFWLAVVSVFATITTIFLSFFSFDNIVYLMIPAYLAALCSIVISLIDLIVQRRISKQEK